MIDHTPPSEVVKRRWYALGQRHRRLAEYLRRWAYFDGSVFHAYHAYECVISAHLVGAGLRVPASHAGRLARFDDILDRSGPIAEAYQRLDFRTIRVRNESLYDEVDGDLCPEDRFDAAYVEVLMPLVHAFARAVWRELR